MVFAMRLAATAVLIAGLGVAPGAQARDWHGRGHGYGGYEHHHGGDVPAALIGGLIGLGLGAAIGSSRYGAPPPAYYGPPPGYYAPPPPAVYYGY